MERFMVSTTAPIQHLSWVAVERKKELRSELFRRKAVGHADCSGRGKSAVSALRQVGGRRIHSPKGRLRVLSPRRKKHLHLFREPQQNH